MIQLHAKPLRTFVPNTNQTMVRPQHVSSTAKSLKIVGTTLGDSVRSNIYNSSHQARKTILNKQELWYVTRQSSQSSSRTTQRSSPRTLRYPRRTGTT